MLISNLNSSRINRHDATTGQFIDVFKALLIDRPRSYQAGYSAPLRRAGHNDEKILQAQQWLQDHYRGEVQLRELARMLGMSQRNFARRFKKATGQQPLAYLQQLRIEQSKSLLEKDYPMSGTPWGYTGIGARRIRWKWGFRQPDDGASLRGRFCDSG